MEASVNAEGRQTKMPPYVSFVTFKNCMADLKDHGVPNKIDRSILTKFSGITGTQLMTAMRFLGLMDQGGKPTERLKELAHAHGTNAWREKLRPILESAYAPVLSVNLATATPKEFSDTFVKAFPGADSVLRRCMAFFLPAASDAGIEISKRILTGRKPRNGNTPPRRRREKTSDDVPDQRNERSKPLKNNDSSTSQDIRQRLLEKFPTFDPQWPDNLKAEWFKGFQQFMELTKEDVAS